MERESLSKGKLAREITRRGEELEATSVRHCHSVILSCGLFNWCIFFRQVPKTFENFQSRSCQRD